MDSIFTVLSLGYYQLKQNLTKEKNHIAAAFAMPIGRNGDIDMSQNTNNDTTDLNTLLFNSYNDSSKNHNENNK